VTGTLPSGERARSAGAPAPGAAISVRAVSKSFRLPHELQTTVKERVLHPFGARSYEALPALRDVTFEVERGEFFGIVGRNGSGKSTLLKCVSGIYLPDAGEISAHGRLAPFIELGVGFNDQLSGRENAILNGVLLGLTPRQARERFDAIVAFAELEDVLDLKLKNYSSGMRVRLAFAVMVHVDADVLLFDEVLAVGDEAFKRKCLVEFDRLREEGRTVVLVTHDMHSVRRFCDRAALLHHGEVLAIDDAAAVANAYAELNADPRQARFSIARGPAANAARDAAPLQRRRRERGQLLRDLPRVATLARVLAVAEFRLRYSDSALSYLWGVMRPLAFFGVLYLFVTKVGRFDNGVNHYPAYLLMALMLWTYFDQATQVAVHALTSRAELVRRVPLPHLVLPLSVVLTAFFDLCLNLLAVLVVLLATGVSPRVSWIELPLLVGVLSLLIAGVAILLSALYVRFRDVDQIWTVVSQALFFGTPIFYVAASLPGSVRKAALANPLAALLTEARHAVVDSGAPSAATAIGGTAWLAVPLAMVAAVLALGLWVFSRVSPSAAESL
jgi:ABC-type polysaccharide/polyol phosphate transport system ATPase subunit/ABC-type polysaccharide/polyol phosphate export permease